jgi:MFS family permease
MLAARMSQAPEPIPTPLRIAAIVVHVASWLVGLGGVLGVLAFAALLVFLGSSDEEMLAIPISCIGVPVVLAGPIAGLVLLRRGRKNSYVAALAVGLVSLALSAAIVLAVLTFNAPVVSAR